MQYYVQHCVHAFTRSRSVQADAPEGEVAPSVVQLAAGAGGGGVDRVVDVAAAVTPARAHLGRQGTQARAAAQRDVPGQTISLAW